jgi:hypothetical protein
MTHHEAGNTLDKRATVCLTIHFKRVNISQLCHDDKVEQITSQKAGKQSCSVRAQYLNPKYQTNTNHQSDYLTHRIISDLTIANKTIRPFT